MAELNADSACLSENGVYLGLSKKMSLHYYKCYYYMCHSSGTSGRWQLCTLEVSLWKKNIFANETADEFGCAAFK